MVKHQSIVSWNVNGLQGILKKDCHGQKSSKINSDNALQKMVDEQQPTIICLQEIRCSSKFNHKPYFPGYDYIYVNHAKKRGYSGTLIASKIEPIRVIYDYELFIDPEDSGLTDEGRMITIELEDYYLVNVYTPNIGVKTFARLNWRVNVWECYFREHIKLLSSYGKPVVIVGDLNVIPTKLDSSWKNTRNVTGATPGERQAFAHLLALGFIDCYRCLYPMVREYTWTIDPQIGHRMDFTLVSKNLHYQDSSILDYIGSDHCPIKLSLDVSS